MFPRIYFGIFLSILLAASSNYLIFVVDNQWRKTEYHHSALSGAMALVQDTLNQQAPGVQHKYLQLVARLLGAEPGTMPISHSQLSRQQLNQLNSGKVVIEDSEQSHRLWLRQDSSKLAFLDLKHVDEQQFRGMSLLLVAELKRQHPHYDLALLRHYSSYPLQLLGYEELKLDPQQRSRLKNGSVVVEYDEQDKFRFSVYAPLAKRASEDYILKIGPIDGFNPLPLKLALIMLLTAITIIVIVTSLLVYALQRRFCSINQMVDDFGAGDLSARIDLAGQDMFANLGKRIDTMANQIQALVIGQRATLQAVSHELRTPLSRIRFRLTMLDEELPDEAVTQKTEAIRNDISQLEKLIEEVLAHQKLTHMPELTMTELNLGSLISGVTENHLLLHESIALRLEVESQQQIVGHFASIERLLANLIANACKHANSEVLIRLESKQNQPLLSIEDDGAGIPEEEQERIFEAFYRIEESRNRKTGGHGLGLAIVKRIAELHDAQIVVGRSKTLGGAKFSIIFPHGLQPVAE